MALRGVRKVFTGVGHGPAVDARMRVLSVPICTSQSGFAFKLKVPERVLGRPAFGCNRDERTAVAQIKQRCGQQLAGLAAAGLAPADPPLLG